MTFLPQSLAYRWQLSDFATDLLAGRVAFNGRKSHSAYPDVRSLYGMRIRLHNIGPLRDADIRFGPLTVLVGPNGSGKTTFTTVAYAVFKAHEAALLDTLELVENPFSDTEEAPRTRKGLANELLENWEDVFTEQLDFELRRCCAPDLATLARARRGGKNAGPRITVSTKQWCMVFRLSGDDLWLETDHPDFRRPRLRIARGTSAFAVRRHMQQQFTSDLPRRAIYFPAGRSGIVQTHTALSALMAGALSGGYFKDATIGAIPGATADFMQLVAQMRPRRRVKRTQKLASRVERSLLRGKVRLQEKGGKREFLFRPEGQEGEWPVENMATAVAEFTPLVLYLRHRASLGDAILIDEPESHLHPESQVSLAAGLIEIASLVSPVVVATHSEFLVSQFSNLMLQQSKRSDPALKAASGISVFLFGFHDEDRGLGADVEPIDLDLDEGFEITQFSEVSERVFSDAIRLYNDLHG
jgi:predicted ATPase